MTNTTTSPKTVHVFWDLSKAKFGSRPEPQSGYYIAAVVDGEMTLLAGDSPAEAYTKTRAHENPKKSQLMVLRREHVYGDKLYTTKADFGGKNRDISIDFSRAGDDWRLYFSVDNKRVLKIKHLKWKFRGNERVEVDGAHVNVSWDVYNWLFEEDDNGFALFMFRFDEERDHGVGYLNERNGGLFWSQQSSCGFGFEKKKMKKSLLRGTRSSSSSSSLSSASSGCGSVMEWESVEENELKDPSEPDIISLDESFEECPQEARFVLVGKILASKVLNISGVQKIIEKAWRTEEEFSISPWRDNVYAFGFKNEDDLCRIISKSPWSVMGSILILRKWDKKKSFSELDFSFSPFWVQIHGLPLGYLNVKTGSAIAESFGDVIAVEDPGERGRLANYLRIRVWLDVSKPLKKGFFLRRPKEDDLWVKFKYERLSDFCYGCGRISHTVKECKERCSFAAKDWVYDGGIRAESAVIDTIQYGDKPLPKLVYPERKNRVVTVDDGGACSGAEGERVNQSGQNFPMDDLVVNQGSRVVECNSARTNLLGSATLQARSPLVESLSGSSSSSGNPCDCGPRFSLGKEVVGLSLTSIGRVSIEDQNRVRAHYFVEEPDSPRRIVVNKEPSPVEDTLTRPLQLGHLAGAFPFQGPGYSEKSIDEGLTNAFSKSLSLKRKCDDFSGDEAGKRVKRITNGETGESEQNKRESVLGKKGLSPTLLRARGRRGRGSRGRNAGRGRDGKGELPKEPCDDELFEVSVEDDYCGDQTGGDPVGSRVISTISKEVSTTDEGTERALVAGPEQPRVQW
ncbi:hypothetical protein RHSIM_Rhsim07G0162600 [Rhododendron simsii]|uniref:CCHC-type domain-containing protein n=1 Tax=Rhododendron simsii TaxID=118357 RepID=A0A834LIG7_RHOSS|nr:hypothetical protein RHSIM_Rhsim07G0162600 [Rhododendron simsii]